MIFDVLKNYGPVGNIPFLVKVIKKDVSVQTHLYLEENLLMPSMQRAYGSQTSLHRDCSCASNEWRP